MRLLSQKLRCSQDTSPDKVQDMKSSEVDNKVNILFFYADWCGHCKTFKPEFQKFQDTLHLTVPENKYQIKWISVRSSEPEGAMGMQVCSIWR